MTSNKQFKELMESVNSGIVVIQDEKIAYINGYAASGVGLPKSKIIGTHFLEFIPKADREKALKRFNELLESQEPVKGFEANLMDGKGRHRAVEINSASTVYNNAPARIISIRDVTELKATEKELKRNENHFKLLFNSLPYGGEVISPDRIILECSPSTAKMLEYSQSEIIGQHITNFLSKDSLPIFKKLFPKLISGKPQSAEIEMVTKTGNILNILRAAQPLFDEQGKVKSILALNTDISKIRKAENKLIEKELFEKSLLNASSDIIYTYDLTKKENIYSNNAINDILGYSKKEIKELDDPVKALMHPSDYNIYKKETIPLYNTLTDGKLIEHEYRMQHKNGEWLWLCAKESIFKRDKNGKPTQIFGIINDITNEKKAKLLLEEKQRQIQSIYDDPNMFIGVLDKNGVLLNANRPSLDFIEKKIEDVNSTYFWDTPWWAHSEKEQTALMNGFNKAKMGENVNFRAIHKNPAGESRFVNFSIRPIRDEDGIISTFLAEGINIDEQMIAEEGLRESEKRYRALTESAPVGVWHADLKGNVTYINPKLSEISGLTFDEATGGKWGTKVHPEDQDRVLKEWDDYINSEKPYMSTYRFVHNDGEVKWVLENATTIFDESNEKYAHIGTITNITDRILSENKLRESEERYQLLSDATFEAIFISDKGLCIGQNKTAEQMFGYKLDEAIGKKGTDWITPEFRDVVKSNMISGIEEPYEAIALRKDGSTFPCEIQARMMEFNGELLRLTALRDITDRKKTQERLELTLESAELGSWDQNFVTGEVYRNDRWYDMLGYSREEVKETKLSWIELIHPDDLSMVKKAARDQEQGISDVFSVEHRLKTKSGKWKWILNWGKVIERDKDGKPLRAVGTHLDINDKKNTELALIDSENKFRSTLEDIHLFAIMLDAKANITFANKYLLKSTGWKKNEVLGKNYFDVFVSKEIRPRSKRRFIEIIKNKKLFSNRVNEVITRDGKQLIVDWNVTAQYDDDGKLTTATSIGNDITKKLQTETDLRFQSELIKQSYESMITTDTDFKISWTNRAFTELYGYTREEVLGRTPDFLNAEQMADEIQQSIYESMKAGKLIKTTLLNKKKDGSTFVVELSVHPILDMKGEVIAYSGHQYDVTKRVIAQKEVEESNSKLESIFRSTPIGIFVYALNSSGDLIFTSTNSAASEILGVDCNKFVGKTIEEAFPSLKKTKLPKIYKEVAKNGKTWHNDQVEYKDNKITGAYDVTVFQSLPGTAIVQFLDNTEKRQAEQILKESEERFRSTFESVSEGIILVGENGRINYVNESLKKMTNITEEDLVGKHVLPLAKRTVDTKQIPTITKSIIKALDHKKIRPFEVEYNQKIFRVSVAFNNLNKNVIGILQDVTDERTGEIELRKYKDHLEDLVEKRTIDLRKKNEELDNALKVFVGRELTIKNLRNEISKLEKEVKKLRN